MNLAYAAGRAGGTMTGVLSAANEQVGGQLGGFIQDSRSRPSPNSWRALVDSFFCCFFRPSCVYNASGRPDVQRREGRLPRHHAAPLTSSLPSHLNPFLRIHAPQAVQMFIDEKIGYLDIMRLNEAACEAHKAELVSVPTLEEIVHYDAWARRYVEEQVVSGAFKPRVAVKA